MVIVLVLFAQILRYLKILPPAKNTVTVGSLHFSLCEEFSKVLFIWHYVFSSKNSSQRGLWMLQDIFKDMLSKTPPKQLKLLHIDIQKSEV